MPYHASARPAADLCGRRYAEPARCDVRAAPAGDVMLLADALEDGQKDVSVWKKYRAWDGAQPFETVLQTKNGE